MAAIIARPIQKRIEENNAIFRKPWFKIPVYAFAFGCAFYGGVQLPGRLFPKLTPSLNHGVDHAVYTSQQDVVSRFRLFETLDKNSFEDSVHRHIVGFAPLSREDYIQKASKNTILNISK